MQPVPTSHVRHQNRLTRRLPSTVFLLVMTFGLIALTSSRAEATCGDYLSHHGMNGHSPMNGDEILGHKIPNGKSSSDGQHGRAPCRGVSCQQAPLTLPVPTPVVSFEIQDRWDWMASFLMPQLSRNSYLTRISDRVAISTIAFRLDRPPKG